MCTVARVCCSSRRRRSSSRPKTSRPRARAKRSETSATGAAAPPLSPRRADQNGELRRARCDRRKWSRSARAPAKRIMPVLMTVPPDRPSPERRGGAAAHPAAPAAACGGNGAAGAPSSRLLGGSARDGCGGADYRGPGALSDVPGQRHRGGKQRNVNKRARAAPVAPPAQPRPPPQPAPQLATAPAASAPSRDAAGAQNALTGARAAARQSG